MAKLNHEKLALNLLTTASVRDAAKKSNVAESTVYRLKKDPEFQKLLNEIKNKMFQETIQKSQGYCLEMLEVLRAVALDQMATDSSRVSAARSVLELGLTMYETEEVIQRLQDLERRLQHDQD